MNIKLRSVGVLAGVFSAISFGSMNFCIKYGSLKMESSDILFFRNIIGLVILTPFVYASIPVLLKKDNYILWVRFTFGGLSTLCLFYNLNKSSIGTALSLANFSPVFILILSKIFLKAKLSELELIGVLLLMTGIFLIQSPMGNDLPIKVALIGMFGALMASIAFLALSSVAKKHSIVLITWGFCAVSAIVAICNSCGTIGLPTTHNSVILILIGIFGVVGQLTMTYSFIHLPAAIACALSLSSIAWGTLFESLYLRKAPPFFAIISYMCIICGAYIIQITGKGLRFWNKEIQTSI